MRVVHGLLAIVLVILLDGCSGCPTALLTGVLVADGAGGLAVRTDDGTTQSVIWPDRHGVRHEAGTEQLVVTGPLGQIVAHEGDHVRLGGGMNPNGPEFEGCGGVAIDDAP